MTGLQEVSAYLAEQLPVLIERYDVPAASVGVSMDGETVTHAAGVLSKATGVEATTDSVFQIGSITKLWTASLVMQLVDEGLVDLDDVVRKYLPEFRIADDDAASEITVRHLLTHTAGFEGDIFTDTGMGDDCVEKYLGVLRDVPQLFPPGEMWSYNNAGFCVLGRLVEVLRGAPYDVCLRRHLVEPLGLAGVATSPYEAILHRAAVGHLEQEPGSGYEPTSVWAFARSNIPAGSMLAMDTESLLGFARMHLADGRSASGTQVLAPGTPASMHDKQLDLPYLGFSGASWGLGFERFDHPGGDIVGHDGSTIGQDAYLRTVPTAGLAVVLLTNGGRPAELYHEVVGHVLAELSSARLPEPATPPAVPARIDAEFYLGTYSCDIADVVVSQDAEGRIWLDQIPRGIGIELGDTAFRSELVHCCDTTLIAREPERGVHRVRAFLDPRGTGHAAYVHGGRALVYAGP